MCDEEHADHANADNFGVMVSANQNNSFVFVEQNTKLFI